jgi:hypothetical protein
MARSNFAHFRLHSGRTEENRHGTSIPNVREQLRGAVRMIAVYDDSGERAGFDDVGYRLLPRKKTRLQTSKLNHKTQQRCDHLLARENQHIAQRRQPKMRDKQLGNLRTFRNGQHVASLSRRYLGNRCPLSRHKSESGGNYCPTSVSPLSDSSMKELRAALADQLKQPDGPTSALADVLKRVGKEAHQKNVPPEELIVIFKEMWNSLAESLRPQNPDQYESVRQRLVTLCIQAYYAE